MKYFLFLFFISCIFLSSLNVVMGQKNSLLADADQLFVKKKYTEAYEKYLMLFNEKQTYSPQMLLKMAYIQEGLEDYPKALYFLNLYYNQNPDKKVLHKMEKIAKAQKYKGYDFGDHEYFMTIYERNKYYIMGFVLVLICLVLGYLFYKKQHQRHILYPALALGVFIMCFGYVFNFTETISQGIVIDNKAFLMDAPAAGSNVISTQEEIKGHRMEVIGKHDIWYAIKWHDKIAYIRNHHLLLIR